MKINKWQFNSLALCAIIAITIPIGCRLSFKPTMEATMAPAEDDAQAKLFKSVPGKSVIYIFRDDHASMINKNILTINSSPIVGMIYGSYVRLILEPGMHVISSQANNECSLTINVAPNLVYYIHQKDRVGWSGPRCSLGVVPESEGQRKIKVCNLLAIPGWSSPK